MPRILNFYLNGKWAALCILFVATTAINFKPTHHPKHATLSYPGNRYFSSCTAKFLGCDSSANDGLFLIDDSLFYNIKEAHQGITGSQAITSLKDSSKYHIHIHEDTIQSLLQLVGDSSFKTSREQQMLIYLDLWTGELSAAMGEAGDDTSSHFNCSFSRGLNFVYDQPHKLLLAQAHGHPHFEGGKRDVVRVESDKDRCVAFCLQGPVYAVIATEYTPNFQHPVCRVGPGDIFKTKRSDSLVCHTQGDLSNKTTHDVGIDALMTWATDSLYGYSKCPVIKKDQAPKLPPQIPPRCN